jgi:hypothetical protein
MLVFLNSKLTQSYRYFFRTSKRNVITGIFAVKANRQSKLEYRKVKNLQVKLKNIQNCVQYAENLLFN